MTGERAVRAVDATQGVDVVLGDDAFAVGLEGRGMAREDSGEFGGSGKLVGNNGLGGGS